MAWKGNSINVLDGLDLWENDCELNFGEMYNLTKFDLY